MPEHLRPSTPAESVIHELSSQELDHIRKVLSGINMGEFTDLVGQPPPADFDLGKYEDHSPDRNEPRGRMLLSQGRQTRTKKARRPRELRHNLRVKTSYFSP